jgi:hypothetical protein
MQLPCEFLPFCAAKWMLQVIKFKDTNITFVSSTWIKTGPFLSFHTQVNKSHPSTYSCTYLLRSECWIQYYLTILMQNKSWFWSEVLPPCNKELMQKIGIVVPVTYFLIASYICLCKPSLLWVVKKTQFLLVNDSSSEAT